MIRVPISFKKSDARFDGVGEGENRSFYLFKVFLKKVGSNGLNDLLFEKRRHFKIILVYWTLCVQFFFYTIGSTF